MLAPMNSNSTKNQIFVYKYIVRYNDIDQFKHMSFANYLKLMFIVVDVLLESKIDHDVFRLKFISSSMKFKKQTILGDKILISVEAIKLLKTYHRMTINFRFRIEGSDDITGFGSQEYEVKSLKKEIPPYDYISKILEGLNLQVTSEPLIHD